MEKQLKECPKCGKRQLESFYGIKYKIYNARCRNCGYKCNVSEFNGE